MQGILPGVSKSLSARCQVRCKQQALSFQITIPNIAFLREPAACLVSEVTDLQTRLDIGQTAAISDLPYVAHFEDYVI